MCPDPRQQSNASPAEVAAAYIYANYARPITVESIAQYIGGSQRPLPSLPPTLSPVTQAISDGDSPYVRPGNSWLKAKTLLRPLPLASATLISIVFSKIFKKTSASAQRLPLTAPANQIIRERMKFGLVARWSNFGLVAFRRLLSELVVHFWGVDH